VDAFMQSVRNAAPFISLRAGIKLNELFDCIIAAIAEFDGAATDTEKFCAVIDFIRTLTGSTR
jgi:hypothetical protein